jgi:hypothetical protein
MTSAGGSSALTLPAYRRALGASWEPGASASSPVPRSC